MSTDVDNIISNLAIIDELDDLISTVAKPEPVEHSTTEELSPPESPKDLEHSTTEELSPPKLVIHSITDEVESPKEAESPKQDELLPLEPVEQHIQGEQSTTVEQYLPNPEGVEEEELTPSIKAEPYPRFTEVDMSGRDKTRISKHSNITPANREKILRFIDNMSKHNSTVPTFPSHNSLRTGSPFLSCFDVVPGERVGTLEENLQCRDITDLDLLISIVLPIFPQGIFDIVVAARPMKPCTTCNVDYMRKTYTQIMNMNTCVVNDEFHDIADAVQYNCDCQNPDYLLDIEVNELPIVYMTWRRVHMEFVYFCGVKYRVMATYNPDTNEALIRYRDNIISVAGDLTPPRPGQSWDTSNVRRVYFYRLV